MISSLANFWLAAFRLPASCLKEIEKLCSAFLWSGPSLNTNKLKIACVDVCRPKDEGGLGIRDIKEMNNVCVLKLIWRILSSKNSLWVRWIQVYLIRKGSIWTVKENTQSGSWMWRKILKYREKAKQFYMVQVKNGKSSFWHDKWSSLGCLLEVIGTRGYIDMGIGKDAMVEEVANHRRRRHRISLLNIVEDEIVKWKEEASVDDDIPLWRSSNDKFKNKFSTKTTWELIRNKKDRCSWSRGVWFRYATPKYAFLTWIAAHNRLSTGDRMMKWGGSVNSTCSLCDEPVETRNHLFFECKFSAAVWENLAKGVMGSEFTTSWRDIVTQISTDQNSTKMFALRYTFQASVHGIWMERNGRRHGEKPLTTDTLIRIMDKNIRNRFTSIQRMGDIRMEDGLRFWFSTRPVSTL